MNVAHRGVLQTRLVPPRLPSGKLDRGHLVERVISGFEQRGTLVVAGAGYGKTTLLVQALGRITWPWAWCSCDPDLTDAGTFLRHVAAAIGESIPGFGSDLEFIGEAPEQVMEFANEAFATLPDEFVLFLDDVHRLPHPAREALDLLARDLPSPVRLAITSRTTVSLPTSRTLVGHFVEITERDLAFGEDEVGVLLATAGRDHSPGTVADLLATTEGWATGLTLAVREGTGSSPNPAVFAGVLEAALAGQPDAVRRFIERTCVLERFTPEIAEHVSGDGAAAQIARHLVAERLFTSRLDAEGEWYRYHQLLAAHVRESLAAREPGALRELHRRSASALRAAGEPEAAARHAIAARDWPLAVDCLAAFAEDVATTAQAPVLASLLTSVPREAYAGNGALLLANASLLLGAGDHEAAFAAMEGIVGRLAAMGDGERAGAAAFRLMQALAVSGTPPQQRVEIAQRHLGRVPDGSRHLLAARLMHAANAAYARRFSDAEAELEMVEQNAGLDRELALQAAVTRAHYLGFARDGRPEALEHLTEAVAGLAAANGTDAMAFLPWARMLRCYELLDLGLHGQALEEMDRVVGAARQRGFSQAPIRSLIWLRAWAHRGLGDAASARAALRHGETQDSGAGGSAYSYRYRAVAAHLAAGDGDVAQTNVHIGLGLQAMDAFGRVSDDPVFLLDFAEAAARIGDTERARALAGRAVAEADEIGAAWQRLRARIVQASLANDQREGDAILGTALELSADPLLASVWPRRCLELAAPLLARAIVGGLGPPGVAERLVAACGGPTLNRCIALLEDGLPAARATLARAAGGARIADTNALDTLLRDRDAGVRAEARRAWIRLRERPRASIRVQTLGGLQVWRDDVPLPESAFERQKSRVLLGLLVARGHAVHREELCEAIWPQLAPDRAAASLRTTLHDLRRALHPELEGSSPAALVSTDGETVGLSLGEQDSVDTWFVRRVVADPSSSHRDLADAEEMCRGRFLPEWPYEDWAERARIEYDAVHATLLARLAATLDADGRHDAAALRWRKLLDLEPQQEAWHRGLMRAYSAAGERALALRQFHACRTVLRREQGIEPGPETQLLYRTILEQDDPV